MNHLEQMTNKKLDQWQKETTINFCRAVKAGATIREKTYPTGLQLFQAIIQDEHGNRWIFEVPPDVYNRLKTDNWTVIDWNTERSQP